MTAFLKACDILQLRSVNLYFVQAKLYCFFRTKMLKSYVMNDVDIEKKQEAFSQAQKTLLTLQKALKQQIIGQEAVLKAVLIAVATGGHILLEGVPGLAKTLICKTVGCACNLLYKRVQFTPDLLPQDITGGMVFEQGTGQFHIEKGPIFSNVLLCDEINRASCRVQAALLEAMEEKAVTISKTTYPLERPFLVMATCNPIEQEGTYNLSESTEDRFLLKVNLTYPSFEEEVQIAQRKPSVIPQVVDKNAIKALSDSLEQIVIEESLVNYCVNIVRATRPQKKNKVQTQVDTYVQYGSSPRGILALIACAKATALINGRTFVLPEDIKEVAIMTLQHRLCLTYEAQARGITGEAILLSILQKTALA